MTAAGVALVLAGLVSLALVAVAIGWPYTLALALAAVALTCMEFTR